MRRIAHLLSPLRSRAFTLIWLGQSISDAGNQVFMIALVWLLVGLTGSSLLMGAILSASYVPTLLLLLFGGAIADRYSRRGVALISDGLRALVTAAFAMLVTLNLITVPTIFAFSTFYGLVSAFFNPAISTLYPSLIEPDQYEASTSLQQITTQAAALGGPALGGYLIARWSIGAALAFDAASFVISFIALLVARRRRARAAPATFATSADRVSATAAPTEQPTRVSRWREMFAGARFLSGEPAILILIVFFSLTNGLNDVEAVLVPRLVRLDLRLSPTAFGLMGAFMGLGGLSGAFLAGMVASRLRWRAQIICGAMVVFGAAIVLMGLAQDELTLDIAYSALGISFAVPEVLFGGLLQRIVPAEIRGRVFSLGGLIAMAMNPPGLFLAGALGDTFGPRAGLWIGGGAIALLAALALLIPDVRALNQREAPGAGAKVAAPVIADAQS